MVTHLSTVKAHGCLTLLILPFTLTSLTFGSCLCCALIEAFNLVILFYPVVKKLKFKDGWVVNFTFFHRGIIRWVTIWRLLFFPQYCFLLNSLISLTELHKTPIKFKDHCIVFVEQCHVATIVFMFTTTASTDKRTARDTVHNNSLFCM